MWEVEGGDSQVRECCNDRANLIGTSLDPPLPHYLRIKDPIQASNLAILEILERRKRLLYFSHRRKALQDSLDASE